MSNFDLTTDADLLSAADAGELFRVEEGDVFMLDRVVATAIEQDDRYGTDWIVVRAETAAEAIEIAREWDKYGFRRSLREADGVVAVCAGGVS